MIEKARERLFRLYKKIPSEPLDSVKAEIMAIAAELKTPDAEEFTERLRKKEYDAAWKHTVIIKEADLDKACDIIDSQKQKIALHEIQAYHQDEDNKNQAKRIKELEAQNKHLKMALILMDEHLRNIGESRQSSQYDPPHPLTLLTKTELSIHRAIYKILGIETYQELTDLRQDLKGE